MIEWDYTRLNFPTFRWHRSANQTVWIKQSKWFPNHGGVSPPQPSVPGRKGTITIMVNLISCSDHDYVLSTIVALISASCHRLQSRSMCLSLSVYRERIPFTTKPVTLATICFGGLTQDMLRLWIPSIMSSSTVNSEPPPSTSCSVLYGCPDAVGDIMLSSDVNATITRIVQGMRNGTSNRTLSTLIQKQKDPITLLSFRRSSGYE